MTDYATTGDGLLGGLQFLAAMVDTGKRASELTQSFQTVPQLLRNVRYDDGQLPLDDQSVKSAISDAEEKLIGNGRLLIRKSGTEPLIRVMAESEDEVILNAAVGQVVEVALIDPHLAAAGALQQADQLEQGALARARVAGYKGQFAAAHLEAHPGQAFVAPGVALADIVELDHEGCLDRIVICARV